MKKISLAFRCSENRDSLQMKNGTYACHKCAHQVLDFTQKSQDEVHDRINKSAGRICGIFKRSQLSQRFLRYGTASFIAATVPVLESCHEEIIRQEVTNTTIADIDYPDEIFGMVVEQPAEPQGGYRRFYEVLSRKLRRPEGVPDGARVYIQFDVDVKGRMINIQIVKGFNKLADKAALRAIKVINYRFTPATLRGEPLETRLMIPVVFGDLSH